MLAADRFKIGHVQKFYTRLRSALAFVIFGILLSIPYVNTADAVTFKSNYADDLRQYLLTDGQEIKLLSDVDTTSTKCSDALRIFRTDLIKRDTLALAVLNTWGSHSKPNSVDYGTYDQCKSIKGKQLDLQYCMMRIVNVKQTNTTTGFGICVPKPCSTDDLIKWLQRAYDDSVYVTISCESESDQSILPLVFGVVFSVLVLIVIYSTVQQARFTELSQLTTCFSLLRNTKVLFNVSDEKRDLKCVDGIRTLTMFWLVMYHTFRSVEYFTPSKINPEDLQQWQHSFRYSFIHYAPLAVDTFLLLGGLLLSYKFMQDREQKKSFNYITYFIHRFIRLTPVLVSAIVFYVLIFRYIRGPSFFADFWLMNNYCHEYWWSAILYVQNIVNPLRPCLSPCWYLSLDMQAVLVSPPLLFILWRFGQKRGIATIWSLITIIAVYVFYKCRHEGFLYQRTQQWFELIYFPTYTRFGVWLIGLSLGYVLQQQRNQQPKSEINMKMSTILTLWILAVISIVGAMFAPVFLAQNFPNGGVIAALFHATHRLFWGLGLSWVIFACTNNLGGPVQWLLNLPHWQLPSRLCYCIYLLHMTIVTVNRKLSRTEMYFNEYLVLQEAIGVFAITALLSMLWTLIFEIPFINLDVYFTSGGSVNVAKKVK